MKINFKYNFFQYVWIFIAGCYIGYGVETIWCLIKHGFIEKEILKAGRGAKFQLLRKGYFCTDNKDHEEGHVVLNMTTGLRDTFSKTIR